MNITQNDYSIEGDKVNLYGTYIESQISIFDDEKHSEISDKCSHWSKNYDVSIHDNSINILSTSKKSKGRMLHHQNQVTIESSIDTVNDKIKSTINNPLF